RGRARRRMRIHDQGRQGADRQDGSGGQGRQQSGQAMRGVRRRPRPDQVVPRGGRRVPGGGRQAHRGARRPRSLDPPAARASRQQLPVSNGTDRRDTAMKLFITAIAVTALIAALAAAVPARAEDCETVVTALNEAVAIAAKNFESTMDELKKIMSGGADDKKK